MYWEENTQAEPNATSHSMVDAVFTISCRQLPQDHAHALAAAVAAVLPWLADDARSGVHTIHVAESGNGWMRPTDMLYPSRRTKLLLRIPGERVADCQALCGRQLEIGGCELQVRELADTRPMSNLPTLFSRYIVDRGNGDEESFLHAMAADLRALDIRPRKMLCGRQQSLRLPAANLVTRSLMVAELELEESLRLQQAGLGDFRWMGCGLFIPHKSIRKVGTEKDPE